MLLHLCSWNVGLGPGVASDFFPGSVVAWGVAGSGGDAGAVEEQLSLAQRLGEQKKNQSPHEPHLI